MNTDEYYLERWNEKDLQNQLSPTKKRRFNNFLRFIKKYNVDVVDQSFIDYGCGSGWLYTNLKKHYPIKDFHVYDVTKLILQKLETQWPEVKIWYGDGTLPSILPSEKFQCAASIEVIEHVPYNLKESFIKDIKRILNKNGYLYITSPIRKYYDSVMTASDMQPVEDWLEINELKELLVTNNFQILEFGTIYIDKKQSTLHRYLLKWWVLKTVRILGIEKRYIALLERLNLGLSMYFFCRTLDK